MSKIPNIAEGDMGGICGSIEQMNSQNHLLQDMFAGMAGHPGFANIVASVVQDRIDRYFKNFRLSTNF